MRITVRTEIPDDQTLRRRWNELVWQKESPQIFDTYDWAAAVSRAYSRTLRPLLIMTYEGVVLRGVAALATDLSQKNAFFLAGTTADYCDFISVPNRRAEFVAEVFAELRNSGLPAVTLGNLPADSATVPLLKLHGRQHGYPQFSRPAYHCAQVRLGSPAERETLKRSLARKKTLRYSLNSLGKQGQVTFLHLKSWSSIEQLLPDFAEMHLARFHATGRTSNLANPERRTFLAHLAESLASEGWLKLSCMKVGDRVVAWNYGFQFAGSWFYYQPTFDHTLQQFSPGLCLLSRIIEEACDSPEIDLVDLGLGAEEYKERFANTGRQTIHVELTRSALASSKYAARYYTATMIKTVPRVESGIRYIRALVRDHGASGVAKLHRSKAHVQ